MRRTATTVLFYGYFALVTAWLLLGLASAIVADNLVLSLRLSDDDQPWIARLIAIPAESEEGAQAGLDYLFSAINLILAVLLFKLRERGSSAGLLAVAMVGTAAAYNMTGHRIIDQILTMAGSDLVDVAHLVAFHMVGGIAYINALLLFPDRRSLGRSERVATWALVAINLVLLAVSLVTATYHAFLFLIFYGVLTPLVGIAALARRARRTANPVVRQQSRILMWALILALFTAALTAVTLIAVAGPSEDVVVDTFRAFRVVFGLIPVALIVALLRLRLWDADRLINKAVVYAILVGLISLGYTGAVLALAHRVSHTGPATVAAIAVSAAIAIGPLRHAAQRLANHLVYGRPIDPVTQLTTLRQRLRDAVDTADTLTLLTRAIGTQLAPIACRVSVFLPDGESHADWPPGNPQPQALVLPITHTGALLGTLTLSPPSGYRIRLIDRRLARETARRLAPTLHQLQLRLALDQELARSTAADTALRASCGEIVTAADTERRRLERNIHDGAQQTLIALGVHLDLVQQALTTDPAAARTTVDRLRTETRHALDGVRALARGLHPQELTTSGISAALRALPVHQVRHIGLTEHGDAARTRLTPDTEAAIYYACLEALQNALKHGRDTIDITLDADPARYAFTVIDHGMHRDLGKPPIPADGAGLASMRARLAEFGGDLSVSHEPERGTTVTGWLPRPRTGAGTP